MQILTHPGGRRVSAQEARLVLAHARAFNAEQWAAHFGVSLRTIRTWMAEGLRLDSWKGPTAGEWRALKADAVRTFWEHISFLDS